MTIEEIGSHCWIDSSVVILKGARICDNCVIDGYIPEGTIVKCKRKYETIPIKK